jgi:SAM-dependent methyltransferase
MKIFYKAHDVPVQSVRLMSTREEAIDFPKGDIHLGYCPNCGFIGNTAFDINLLDYSKDYESTQSYSTTFKEFHHSLAKELIAKFDLNNKKVLEIGCGQGEFLDILCSEGNMTGIGFDPALDPDKVIIDSNKAQLIPDYYSAKYKKINADFICCKMTLEHIPNTLDFLKMVRNSLTKKNDPIVFFQIPATERILEEVAFWDIYYEHCSYFTEKSIANLFIKAGFSIEEIWKGYNDQYLMIAATADNDFISFDVNPINEIELNLIISFHRKVDTKINLWIKDIKKYYREVKRIVLWGSGSKAVSFLNLLKMQKAITYVVDINPIRQNTYIVGTGQKIVPPEFLQIYKPDLVIVMNEIYKDEIKKTLKELGIKTQIKCLV